MLQSDGGYYCVLHRFIHFNPIIAPEFLQPFLIHVDMMTQRAHMGMNITGTAHLPILDYSIRGIIFARS
jgi:hypothetical protein